MTRYEKIKDIENTIAATLNRELGVLVEVTAAGVDQWSVCGTTADCVKAVRFLGSKNLMHLTGSVYDEELDESFFYLQAA